MPSLILIDGGLGQLHAAADALTELGLTTQPLASIAKREEIIYVHGQEDAPHHPRSPARRCCIIVIQRIRDESHRFAVTYHRKRRQMRDRTSELDDIPGVGPITRQRLLEHFGSVRALKQAAEKDPRLAHRGRKQSDCLKKSSASFAAHRQRASPKNPIALVGSAN